MGYSSFHIVWLIGNLLRERYELEGFLFPSDRASAIAEQIDEWFSPLYTVAVTSIRNTLRQARDSHNFTGNHKEFFRSAASYRLMESNLQGAFRMARDFGDPFANLPP